MSKATYPLKLPRSVKDAAARLAKDDGVSLNQWISAAVAEKVGSVETAALFLTRRSNGGSEGGFSAVLERVADVAPQPGDELPSHGAGRK